MNPDEIAVIIQREIDRRLDAYALKQFQRGIVVDVNGRRADVQIEGSENATGNILCISNYTPRVNDKVLVLRIGTSGANFLILGNLDAEGEYANIENEIPTGDINGVNTTFTLEHDYVPGTLRVYLNGQRQMITDDYTESGDNTIDFVDPPLTNSKILVDSVRWPIAIDTSDTVDGIHASATPAANKLLALGSNSKFDIAAMPDEIGWIEIARTTLEEAADVLTVNNIPNYKYLRILVNIIAIDGTIQGTYRFNNDSGNNYCHVTSASFADAAPGSTTSTNMFHFESGQTDSGGISYGQIDVINISDKEKLVTAWGLSLDANGAATVPTFYQLFGKWANTAAVISRFDFINDTGTGTGNIGSGSEVIILGHN